MHGVPWGIDWLRSGGRWAAAALCTFLLIGATSATAGEPAAMSAEARAVFDRAKDKLLRLRVIHKATRAKSSSGTGFVVTHDGLVLTNYHVVAKAALDPASYDLRFERADGSVGSPRVLAVDVASDLAVLSTDLQGQAFLAMRPVPLQKGERGFAIGYPLDLGLAIVEGTYNGRIENEFSGRLHYTGAVNPGMSGGPAVALDGTVFGINVARRADGQLAGYLVPSEHAVDLLRRATVLRQAGSDLRKEVAAQLLARQDRLIGHLTARPIPTTRMGQYTVPDAPAAFMECSAFTPDKNAKLYHKDAKACFTNSWAFVDDGLSVGIVSFYHRVYEARALGAVRFASLLEQDYGTPLSAEAEANKKELTAFRCTDDFVRRPAGTLRVALCTRAYRSFEGLYDVHLRAVSVDSTTSGLVTTLSLSGVSFENGIRFAQRYLEAVSWTN